MDRPNYPLPVATTDSVFCRAGVSDTAITMMAAVRIELCVTISRAVRDA